MRWWKNLLQRIGVHCPKTKGYFDYAAVSPVLSEALRAQNDTYDRLFANPGSIHQKGENAREYLSICRGEVAKILGAYEHDVVFTRGGTESINLAIQGIISLWKREHPEVIPVVISSPYEHSAVRETLHHYENLREIEVVYLTLDQFGCVDFANQIGLLNERCALVTCMAVNNETGIKNNIRILSRIVNEYRQRTKSIFPYIHTDAVQLLDTEGVHAQSMGCDLVSLSGSKIGATRSIGVLLVRKNIALPALMYGGGQEFGIRPGTEDLGAISSFVNALAESGRERTKKCEKYAVFQNFARGALLERIPGIVFNSSQELVALHILSISIPHCESEYAVLYLDHKGFQVASQSSCSAHNAGVPHTISVLWSKQNGVFPENYAHIRISWGRETTLKEVKGLVNAIVSLYERTQ